MGRERTLTGGKPIMDNNGGNNRFSSNFLSLQLQLKTLLEEAGGDELIPFLDALGSLHRSEQKIVLKMLARTIKKLIETTPRFPTDGDLALKQFEDTLYQDLVEAINCGDAAAASRKRIEVLPGGKHAENSDQAQAGESTLIDLAAARKKRKVRPESLFN